MSDINVLKIFHHATFDITFLAQKYSLDVNNIHCTKVAEKILFPLNNPDFYSLKSIHKRYLGIEINKSLQKSDWLAKNLSDDQICYALQDVIHLEDIQKEQTSRLAKEGKEMLMKRCMDFLTTRVTLDCTGAGDVFKY